MFNTLDQLIRVQFRRSRFELWREALIRWAGGIAGALAGFQVFHTLLGALE